MRKAIGYSSLVFLAITLTVGTQHLVAQQTAAKPAAKAARAEAAATTELPVTRVSLYKNGVGFFEHAGRVTGDQSVTIDFTTAQLNDVLQSLTAIDLNGGRIAGAGYNSTTPLEEQLKALPLALGEDATAVDFYEAIRGARVEVHGPGETISGRLLNIELVNTPEGDNKPALEKRLITVIGEGGEVRTVELTSATTVTLLDADLHQDVTSYLQLLASTRNQGLRHLTLQDNGTGTRELRVSYISEVPIWKSTYRILFTEPKAASAATGDSTASKPQTATLQGWSVVDNTTGADWINVQLSLIAGAPQSFIQPLSVPYYSRRPEIGLPQEAQLTPQTHESGEAVAQTALPLASAPAVLQAKARAVTGMGNGTGSGYGAGVAGGVSGIYGGSGQTNLNANLVESAPLSMNGGPRDATAFQYLMSGVAAEQAAANSIAPNSTTAAFDDYFAYNLTEPITIRKNESAMVPILQTKIDAERVTLWSQQQPTPLRALWITNTSKLTLDRGSFSIVEDGNFGGEGLMEPIHPDERRLLSYAVDQAVRVNTEEQNSNMHATEVTASKGVMMVHHTQTAEITYVVHNAATDGRTVVIEHPIRQGFVLDNGSDNKDPKPDETTPTLYRFRVTAAAGETARLHVGEHHKSTASYQLTNFNDNQLTFILNQTNNSEKIKQALQPILDARRHVAEMQEALDKVNAHLDSLRSDEERQRANVTALANADKASRERFVHDLNATEDQIAAAQKELTAAQKDLQAAKDDLASKIESLQIDEKL
jgi:chaperonin cofactor prefoldin